MRYYLTVGVMEHRMSTATALKPAALTGGLTSCARCGTVYDWKKSGSWSLKMTYCSALCEKGDLGFTLEFLLRETHIERLAWRSLLVA